MELSIPDDAIWIDNTDWYVNKNDQYQFTFSGKIAHGNFVHREWFDRRRSISSNNYVYREVRNGKLHGLVIQWSETDFMVSHYVNGERHSENSPAYYFSDETYCHHGYHLNGHAVGKTLDNGQFLPLGEHFARCKTFEEVLKIWKMNQVLER